MTEELETTPKPQKSHWKRSLFFYVMFFLGSSIILTVAMFFVVTYKLEKRALAVLETLEDPAEFIHRIRRTEYRHAKESPPAVDKSVKAAPDQMAEAAEQGVPVEETKPVEMAVPPEEAVSCERVTPIREAAVKDAENIDTLLAAIPERTPVEKDTTETDRAERVKRVARIISAMEPEAAGKVVSTLNDDLAAEILLSMQTRSSGEVLSNVSPEKMGKISKAMVEMEIETE